MPVQSQIPILIDGFEAYAGATLATGLTCVGGIFLWSTLFGPGLAFSHPVLMCLGIMVGAFIFDAPILIPIWRGVFSLRRPIGPAAAAHAPALLLVFRPILSLSCLAHYSVILTVLLTARGARAPENLFEIVFLPLFLGAVAVAGNVFLALAVKYMTGSDAAVAGFWRRRFLVDAFTVAVVVLVTHGL